MSRNDDTPAFAFRRHGERDRRFDSGMTYKRVLMVEGPGGAEGEVHSGFVSTGSTNLGGKPLSPRSLSLRRLERVVPELVEGSKGRG